MMFISQCLSLHIYRIQIIHFHTKENHMDEEIGCVSRHFRLNSQKNKVANKEDEMEMVAQIFH